MNSKTKVKAIPLKLLPRKECHIIRKAFNTNIIR